jgi:hypothetical protein
MLLTLKHVYPSCMRTLVLAVSTLLNHAEVLFEDAVVYAELRTLCLRTSTNECGGA